MKKYYDALCDDLGLPTNPINDVKEDEMKKFIDKWSTWWIFSPNNKQLNESFKKELQEIFKLIKSS